MTETVEEAVGAAIGALRNRERTTVEIHEWLLSKGYAVAETGEAIARLVEIGELDDERFAIAFAEDKRTLAGWGSERIEAALNERGLPADLSARAAAAERRQELERAVTQLFKRGRSIDDDSARSSALGYLTRRGYPYELAYDAVRRASAGDDARC